jgi:hypothetical protein
MISKDGVVDFVGVVEVLNILALDFGTPFFKLLLTRTLSGTCVSIE